MKTNNNPKEAQNEIKEVKKKEMKNKANMWMKKRDMNIS